MSGGMKKKGVKLGLMENSFYEKGLYEKPEVE